VERLLQRGAEAALQRLPIAGLDTSGARREVTRLADQLASVTRLARRRVQAIALTGLDARTTTANPAATEARPALGGVAPAVAAWFGQVCDVLLPHCAVAVLDTRAADSSSGSPWSLLRPSRSKPTATADAVEAVEAATSQAGALFGTIKPTPMGAIIARAA